MTFSSLWFSLDLSQIFFIVLRIHHIVQSIIPSFNKSFFSNSYFQILPFLDIEKLTKVAGDSGFYPHYSICQFKNAINLLNNKNRFVY